MGVRRPTRVTGAYVLFADGAVNFLSNQIDPKIPEALTTINGGEDVTVE